MTDPRDPLQRLEEAGARPVPPPDPVFTNRLDARLRAAHASAPEPAPGHAARRHTGRALPTVLAVAAVVVIVAVVGTVTRRDRPEGLTLTTATSTDVVLPDGTVLGGRAGLALPEGALVQTGDGGRAAAGQVEVSSGSTAVVIDGELVVVDDEPAPPPTVTSTTAGPGTSAAPPSTSSPTTRPMVTTTTTRPATTTTTIPAPVRIELRADRSADGVRLRWSRYERPDFARYVVVRIQDGEPTVIAERLAASATGALDHPPRGQAGYRIVVLNREGRVVGGSPVVSP